MANKIGDVEKLCVLKDVPYLTVDFSKKLYSDVSPETNVWSNKSIILLSMNNITFRPTKSITRAEAVKTVKLMLDYPGGFTVSPGSTQTPAPVPPR